MCRDSRSRGFASCSTGTPRSLATSAIVWPVSARVGSAPVRFAILRTATSQYAGLISMPYPTWPRTAAAAMVLALPVKGSYATSPASLNASTKNSTSARGNGAECEPWLDSDFTSITFEGRAMPAKRPSSSAAPALPAAEPRAPVPSRPLPDVDLGLFGEYPKQSSETWPTAVGRNLICGWRQKWETPSHAFLKRFGHPPGTPSSVFLQPKVST